MRTLIAIVSALTLVSLAPAQDCATLSISQTNGDVSIELTTDGSEQALGIIALGMTEGNTSIDFGPLGSLELGLAMPFVPLPIGFTDMTGDVSRAFTVPPGLPALDLFAQGFTAELSIGLGDGTFPLIPMIGWSFCTSNVVPVQIGH